MRARRVILLLLTLLIASAATNAAETPVEFIELRMDEGRDAAHLWQVGWTSVYAGVALVQGGMAMAADNQDDQVVNAVGALRAIAALALMRVRPDPGRFGADPIRAAGPPGSPERLAAAEELLHASAHHAGQRYSPRRHILNVGLNAFFGGLVWAFGDSDDAIISTLTGIAGGEAALLTRSRQPIVNAREYDQRFSKRLTWEAGPMGAGVGVRVRF